LGKIALMANTALSMWQTTQRAFMEHDRDLVAQALGFEEVLNKLEKEITAELAAYGRASSSQEEKTRAMTLSEVVGDLELIGDYCKDILERIEIKIEEKLLFSEEAVQEYETLYKKTEDALDEIASALDKQDLERVSAVMRSQEHIDVLVDQMRARHSQRLIKGLCTPIACNMFLNMLDFTAAVYYHAKKIAKNLLRLNHV